MWQRSSELRFPVQYYKFVTKDVNSEQLVEYTVEDIPENRYEEACRFMVKHFVPSEPKLVVRNGQNDPLVLEDYFNKYMHGIKQKVSVGCFKKGSNEFVGVNILEVLGRNNSSYCYEIKSKTCMDINEAVDRVLEGADTFNRHNCDYYLSGTGLAIDPTYRGLGIATEMLKARVSMMKFWGLRVSSTGFSSIGAQKAAVKAGYVTVFSMSYKELAEINPNWDFCGTDTASYDQMTLTL